MHRLPIPGQPLLEKLLHDYCRMAWLLVGEVECGGEGTEIEGKERMCFALVSYMCSGGRLLAADEPIFACSSRASVPIGSYLLVH